MNNQDICFNCNERGHLKRNCTQRVPRGNYTNQSFSNSYSNNNYRSQDNHSKPPSASTSHTSNKQSQSNQHQSYSSNNYRNQSSNSKQPVATNSNSNQSQFRFSSPIVNNNQFEQQTSNLNSNYDSGFMSPTNNNTNRNNSTLNPTLYYISADDLKQVEGSYLIYGKPFKYLLDTGSCQCFMDITNYEQISNKVKLKRFHPAQDLC
jgi:hypothetical protein